MSARTIPPSARPIPRRPVRQITIADQSASRIAAAANSKAEANTAKAARGSTEPLRPSAIAMTASTAAKAAQLRLPVATAA